MSCTFHSLVLATFTDQISLGTLIVGVIVVILFAIATFRDRQVTRWRELYNLADTERKELGEELVSARSLLTEQKETIAKLDALQMPVRVIEALSENARESHQRYEALVKQFNSHEERAQQRFERSQDNADKRHSSTLKVLEMIAERLGSDH